MDMTPLDMDDGAGISLRAHEIDAGRASAVVIVHGIFGWSRMDELAELAGILARKHDVLAVDMRGHGDSGGSFSWGREEWRGVVAAARRLARPGRTVTAIGFSFGGYHSARAAIEGAPIDRLILSSAPVDLRVIVGMTFGRRLRKHVGPAWRRRRRGARFEWPRALRAKALKAAQLARIHVPTLVLHAEDDWLIGRRHAVAYATGIPGARLVTIAGGLHAEFAMGPQREALVGAIEAFLPRV